MALLTARPKLEPGSAMGPASALAMVTRCGQCHSCHPTTYWQKANDHAHLLDRAQVSALAKQVIINELSWQEAQSRLDDWIDAVNRRPTGP